MMGIAGVAWHWPPEIFWKSTPHEWWAAYEVWRDMNRKPDEA